EIRSAQFAGLLWDSRRQLSPPGAAGAGVFSRLPIKLWDSTRAQTGQDQSKEPDSKKSKSHFTPKAHETLANQRGSTKIPQLGDGYEMNSKLSLMHSPPSGDCPFHTKLSYQMQRPYQ